MLAIDTHRFTPGWNRLRALIDERSLKRGQFTLSSGRPSTYLFQLRPTILHPEGQFHAGTIIVSIMQQLQLRAVGGLELGAVPLVCAASFASHIADYPVEAFFVRKQAKVHGAMQLVDGDFTEGSEILFVDDVTTSGASLLKAIDSLSDRKFTVRWALSVLDRDEGAEERFAERGIKLLSLFKKSDFGL